MLRSARQVRCDARLSHAPRRAGAIAVATMLASFGCGNASPGAGATKPGAKDPPPAPSDPEPVAKADAAPQKAPAPDANADDATADEPNADTAPSEEPVQLDIEFVPTPDNVVRKMLGVAKITKHDVVYDLGCGDGRLVIAAAKKFGAKGIGFDLDPVRVAEARANVEKAGVGHLVAIEQKNIFEVDLSPASVVTLYLLPSINVRLIPQLDKLAPGSRIISHDFGMEGVEYDDVWTIVAKHHRPPPPTRDHYVYKWTAPLKKVASVQPE